MFDPIDTISGTLGLSGAADTILVLDRKTGSGATLYARGRDIEEVETAVEFDKQSYRWNVMGDAGVVRRSPERKAILDCLEKAKAVLTMDEIAETTGEKKESIKQLLHKMKKSGEIENPKRGHYCLWPYISSDRFMKIMRILIYCQMFSSEGLWSLIGG